MTFINSLDASSNKITLTKYDPPAPELLITDQECTMIAFLDTETTGVDRMNDQIIELAIKVVEFESTSGKILSIHDMYESFNDPGEDISDEIIRLTGIDNNLVECDDKKIDLNKIDYAIVSPGISPSDKLLKSLENSQCKLTTDIEIVQSMTNTKFICVTNFIIRK